MSTSERLMAMAAWLLCLGPVAAEEAWTVPSERTPVVFSFPAVVDLDRGKAATVMPTCRDVVVIDAVLPGAPVRIGDPLIVFSSTVPQTRAKAAVLSLVEAEHEAARREQELDRDRAQLLAEQSRLEQDLLVAEANLAAARAVDADRLRVLDAETSLAAAELEAARRALGMAEVRHRAGTLEADALRAAQRRVDRADEAAAAKTLERDRARQAADALLVQRRAAQVDALRAQLGLGADGKPDPAAGIRGRIAAQEASQKRERRQAVERRDEAMRDLHMQERDGWDHTPVVSIAVAGPQTVQVAFAPEPVELPAGFQRAGVEPLAEGRAWGWTAGKPRLLTRTGRAASGLALVRGRAVWSAALPDGSYTVTVTLGDTLDWDGALVSLASGDVSSAIAAYRRIDARKTVTATGTIAVTGGRLDVIFGDQRTKALRATVAGTALPREFIKPGWKPGWLQDPAVFVVAPEAVRLRGRVHQTLAPLLATAKPVIDPAADAQSRLRLALATTTVRYGTRAGIIGQADVASTSTRPEALTVRQDDQPGNPLDKLGNEVLLRPTLADAARLRLGEEVDVIATVTPPDDSTVLPAHLVAVVSNRSHIQPADGAPREVTAVRVGDHWIIAELIPPGTRLVPPDLAAVEDGPRLVPGEVVAGVAVPVVAVASGGRIATLIEEGTQVTTGQVVATLYNPFMEDRREESERQKARAREAYRNAGETRRVADERAAAAQREQAVAEQLARLDVGLARLDAPVTLLQAEQAAKAARQSAADAAETLARAEAQAAIDPLRVQSARSAAAAAALKARQAELSLVRAARGEDWFGLLRAEGAWADATAAVAGREADLQLARADGKVSAMQAELRLQQALQGNRWEQRFLAGREIKATANGRLFYRNGWDDRTNRDAKFEKDFWLWRGMTLADVLDMEHLAFKAEVPEDLYRRIQAGAPVELVFAQFNHRRISASISEVGRALLIPREGEDQADAATTVARRRLVPVTIAFTPPADLRDRMVPGTKGSLVLP